MKVSSHFDQKTGKLVTAPLYHPRLKEGAIPSQFPGCPKYTRGSPNKKRWQSEDAAIEFNVIQTIDRGGLSYPHPNVIDVVCYSYVTFQKIISSSTMESVFIASNCQRALLCAAIISILQANELFLFDICDNGHSSEKLLLCIVKTTVNILLNNYCKQHNDNLTSQKKNRKLNTMQK